MDFNDGSEYRVVTDPAAHLAARDTFCFRVASARNGIPYLDTAFSWHRRELSRMPALLMYQFVWADAGTPEEQARYFVDAIGTLRPNEMVMLDIEAGGSIPDPVDFTRRWLAVVEPALNTRAWIYIPSTLADRLTPAVTGDRLRMAPRYSGTDQRGPAPWWPHDVHQYTDRGPFPGCPHTGDVSHTDLTAQQLLDRCQPERTDMVTSYNGWSAATGWTVGNGKLAPLVVAGEPFSPGVRAGDVHTVLQYVAQQLHNRVEPVYAPGFHAADDWGYSYRINRNANNLSCHASGTAIDYNATRHPNGKSGTFTAAQVREIRKILAEVGVVHWGGDFTGTKDEMHWEIAGTAAQVAAAAAKIRGGATGSAVAGDGILEKGDSGESVKSLQRVLNAWYPNDIHLTVDGDFGDATETAVKLFQSKAKLDADGVAGPATLAALGLAGLR